MGQADSVRGIDIERLGLRWRQYIPVVAAGFSCGMGLIGTLGIGFTFHAVLVALILRKHQPDLTDGITEQRDAMGCERQSATRKQACKSRSGR